MNKDEIELLAKTVSAELDEGLKNRALIDEQLAALRERRAKGEGQIATARAMLRFAETALQAMRDSPSTPIRSEAAPAIPAIPPAEAVADPPSHELQQRLQEDIQAALNESQQLNSMSERERIRLGLAPGSAESRQGSQSSTLADASDSGPWDPPALP